MVYKLRFTKGKGTIVKIILGFRDRSENLFYLFWKRRFLRESCWGISFTIINHLLRIHLFKYISLWLQVFFLATQLITEAVRKTEKFPVKVTAFQLKDIVITFAENNLCTQCWKFENSEAVTVAIIQTLQMLTNRNPLQQSIAPPSLW